MNMPAEPLPVEKPEPMPQSPHAGHETTDIRVSLIVKSLVGLFVAVAVCLVGLTALTAWYERIARRADPPLSPMNESQTPPLPRLQAQPRVALADYLAAEQTELTQYRWADREKQTVELPIERAMQLLAERGIPAPAGPAATANTPSTTPASAPPDAKEAPR